MPKELTQTENGITVKWVPANYAQRMQQHWENLKVPIGEAMKKGMEYTIDVAASNMKTYTGTGAGSLQLGANHSLTQQYGSTGFKVGSYSISVNIMEFGRKPRSTPPPVDAIANWMGTSENAFKIARVIGLKGIKRTRPVLKAQSEGKAKTEEYVISATDEVFERLGLI